jgi:uncharacterized membrane protein
VAMSDTAAVEAGTVLPAQMAKGESFENEFRRHYPTLWWATLAGPFVLSAVLVVAVWSAAGWAAATQLLAAAAATFFFAGRFVILGGVVDEADFLTPGRLLLLSIYMDVMTAVVLAFHTGFLFRLPVVGRRLALFADEGQRLMANNPWMRRMTFAAVVLFVTIPVAATGSIAGSILGRLLGMTRLRTFLAVVAGSVIGAVPVYLFADWIVRNLDLRNPWVTVGGLAVIAVILVLLNWWYRRHTRPDPQGGRG